MTGKVSALDKLKGLGLKAKEYIQENPEQVEQFKEQAIGALKQTVDKETEKEAAKIGESEEDGKEPSKLDKYKAQALGVLKPQLDKLAAEQEAAAEESAEAEEDEADKDEDEADEDEGSAPATGTAESRSSANITATTATNSSSSEKIQDLVTGLLCMLDDANLSSEEQKKAVNAFNAAFALRNV